MITTQTEVELLYLWVLQDCKPSDISQLYPAKTKKSAQSAQNVMIARKDRFVFVTNERDKGGCWVSSPRFPACLLVN